MDKSWIIEGLKKPGKTRTGLAKALARAPSMVTALLREERELKVREVSIIARYLEVDPPHQAVKENVAEPAIGIVYITGEVAGGVWTEPGLDFVPIPTTVARDSRWPSDALYLLRVRGTSVNRQARDGDMVLCLDAFSAPRPFQSGDWVIAERERNGLIETTVKMVGYGPGGEWMLFPDSDDKQFQNPIPLNDDQHGSIRVKAFVLDFIRKATDF